MSVTAHMVGRSQTSSRTMFGQSDSHPSPGGFKPPKSDIYNLIPPRAPPNLTNPSLYAGRSTKPIPLELSLPLRWQRGAQFLAVSLSLTPALCFLLQPVASGVFCLRILETAIERSSSHQLSHPRSFFPSRSLRIRRWFAPYKSLIFGADRQSSVPQPDDVLSQVESKTN
ncbi:hypothetical protein VP01_320g1 [Puccinia sorghi]|uniref:Uncharacterized protein n=1 Tax=Puccinia sorghi TaxID=27349 RepID=A0A0L6UZ70_9BASI|nr:hypothetical protein VP01_320g1 [Puccinia sorghi]